MQKTYTSDDIEAMPKEYRRNLINCLSGFKSLCLVGTRDRAGQSNLSVVSSVIHVGANPPLLGMLMRPHVVPRHTIENIEETQHFTLNHVTEAFWKQAHQSSARYPRAVSEFEATGLEEYYSESFPAPYVGEALVQIGLRFVERHHITVNATQFFVGEIMELRLPMGGIEADGFVDLEALGTLTASGLDSYHEGEWLGRLPYAKTGSKA